MKKAIIGNDYSRLTDRETLIQDNDVPRDTLATKALAAIICAVVLAICYQIAVTVHEKNENDGVNTQSFQSVPR